MAKTMHDISGFAGTLWDREFLTSFKQRDGIYNYFRTKMVPPGIKTVNVPIFGGLTANSWTPGAGNEVTLQAGTRSTVAITLDQAKETSFLTDNVEALQSAVDDRAAAVEEITNALLAAVDTSVLNMCASYTSLPAGQKFATATELADTAAATVATEVERLIMEGCAKLDTLLGTSVGNRFVVVDSWLYRRLLAASGKQSPEIAGGNFAYSSGLANPIQGCKIVPAATTSRSYDSYNTRTSVKMYLAVPSAIAVGIQQLPDLAVTYEGLLRSQLVSAGIVYGLKEAVSNGFIELTVKMDGNVFGL